MRITAGFRRKFIVFRRIIQLFLKLSISANVVGGFAFEIFLIKKNGLI